MVRTRTGNKDVALIKAGVELFLLQGVRKTTVKQIAERAGVSVGTVYCYYTDKLAIVRAVAFAFADQHCEFVDAILGSDEKPLVKLEQYLLGLYDMWQPFGQNDQGPVDLAEFIIAHAHESLGLAEQQFHRAVSACLLEARDLGMRVEDSQQEARWIALATSPFFPLAGTPVAHPLRGRLQRDDLSGFIAWLTGKFEAPPTH